MTLRFGPLDENAWLVCIDMQRLFLEPGVWFCPAGLEIIPACRSLITAAPERCMFTRFIPAERPEQALGTWRGYYERWSSVTLDAAGHESVSIHSDLIAFARADRTFDKPTHDAFKSPEFTTFINRIKPSALILSGIETDVCVLATALSAVDSGIRTIIPADALASSDQQAHQATLSAICPRFDMQIEISSVDAVSTALRRARKKP